MSGLTFIDNDFQLHRKGENTVNFQTARQDIDGVNSYYGWLATDGSHIIMHRNATDPNDTITKYFYGASTEVFQTNWDNRKGFTPIPYVEYNALFA